MIECALALYPLLLFIWWRGLKFDGGVGIGARALMGFSLFVHFLAAPPIFYLQQSAYLQAFGDMEYATLVMALGFGAYLLGAYHLSRCLGPGPNRPSEQFWRIFKIDSSRIMLQRMAIAMIVIGVVMIPIAPYFYWIPTVRALVSQSMRFADIGFLILGFTLGLRSDNKLLIQLLLALTVFGFFRAVLTGFFGSTLYTYCLLVGLATVGRRVTVKSVAGLALAVTLAFIPYSIWLQRRGALRTAIEQGQGWGERLRTLVVPGESFVGTTNTLSDTLQERINFLHLLSAAMDYVPSKKPFDYGTIFTDILPALVPRYFLPTKSYVAGDTQFIVQNTGMQFQNCSVGAGYPFEFYVNFGSIGVVVGLGCLGFTLAYLERRFYTRAMYEPWMLWVFPMLSLVIVTNVNRVAEMCVSAASVVLVGMALRYLPFFARLEATVLAVNSRRK